MQGSILVHTPRTPHSALSVAILFQQLFLPQPPQPASTAVALTASSRGLSRIAATNGYVTSKLFLRMCLFQIPASTNFYFVTRTNMLAMLCAENHSSWTSPSLHWNINAYANIHRDTYPACCLQSPLQSPTKPTVFPFPIRVSLLLREHVAE